MKKLVALFSILATLMIVVSSCETKDPIVEKGTLQSATYNPATKSFTLTYSSGQTETVNAVVDDKTDPPTATATLKDGTVIYAGDATVAGAATIAKEINIVSQFVYDGMSLYYFWADEVKNKKPTVADVNPENYFYKILNSTDTQHGWSWITDDINSLLSGFSGEATDAFGFQPFPLYADDTYTTVVGFIRYVYPDSPADKAGLKRGEVITKINGQTITTNNYTLLYGANAETTFTVTDQYFKNPRDVKVMPAKINTDPVLYSNVYEMDGKKIGYLFYTNFYENYNASLYQVFSEFKTAGVTDLVLDLRYNPGGGISAATYLASLIAPESNVRNKDVFTVMSYNSYVNGIFDKNKWDRRDYLGDYNNAKYQDPLNANLNLNKVYVIATGSSASASELITFCLEPFMQVEHIGEKTAGKYTASWTIHAYDDFENRVQPIYVESKLTDSEKDKLK
ncbi:MAG TPA: hypothetical protein DC016_04965, partial [Porphyromonadaceae bacterium]|nr:hypothetical protein [Porphyromonadaceae bacterium]